MGEHASRCTVDVGSGVSGVDLIIAAGGFVIALGMVAGAVGVIAKSQYLGRPVRWLWRTNVARPFDGWVRHTVGEVVDQRIDYLMHNRNGGSSLLDLAEKLEGVEGNVALLLAHDAERDTKGHRYGPNAEHLEEGESP
jgi:hypothetical protein